MKLSIPHVARQSFTFYPGRNGLALAALLALPLCLLSGMQQAGAVALTLAQTPLATTNSVPPMVMLDLTKDHSLFYRAYNDYTALKDNDATLQITYDNAVDYYGIFDNAKCYVYTGTSSTYGYFTQAALAVAHYCTAGSNQWSGNMLNWATTTRMDAVRKLLYGGMRTTDTATQTIVSRSITASDGHAFAKYYNGADLNRLTPFSNQPKAPFSANDDITLSPSRYALLGDSITNTPTYIFTVSGRPGAYSYLGSVDVQMGDSIKLEVAGNPNAYVVGYVSSIADNGFLFNTSRVGISVRQAGIPATLTSNVRSSNWKITNLTQVEGGVTFCGLSRDPKPTQSKFHIARGNYTLWAANERYQCRWAEDVTNTQQVGSSNGNIPLVSRINASTDNPIEAIRGLNALPAPYNPGEYFLNVYACDTRSLTDAQGVPLGNDRCKQYPNGNYKPIGLLQTYGDTNAMQFGLMTGSFSKNISGGVLRRKIANFSEEVNTTTDGTFVGSAKIKGIVHNINQLYLAQMAWAANNYLYDDKCTYELYGLVHSGGTNAAGMSQNEGYCVEWGNPMSEIYLESLRYYAGKQPTPAFLYDENSAINVDSRLLNMSQERSWTDPINNQNYCASLNVIAINSAYTSYDSDQMNGFSDLGSAKTVAQWTKLVGDGENITGSKFFVGRSDTTSDIKNFTCTAKTINDLSSVQGVCPESPAHEGSFLMAGAAYYAHTNRIRSDLNFVPTTDKKSLKVDTYGIQLASSAPKITVSVNGKQVVIMPSYELDVIDVNKGINSRSSGTLVDFRVISQTPTSGSFYANWEDSAQGGDYDQDLWGLLSYQISGDQIAVTTIAVATSSTNGQGFGYVISGTEKDGVHYHSGAYNFNYTDPVPIVVTPATYVNATGGCKDCNPAQPATTVVYTATGGSSNLLQEPMYYAAKWGGFDVSLSSEKPPRPAAADTTGNYFYVTNPGQLETALGKTLQAIGNKAGQTSLAANSSSLTSVSAVYQASYNPNDWSGQLYAYPISGKGQVSTTARWEASARLRAMTPDSRVIVAYDKTGTVAQTVPFKADKLPPSYLAFLNRNAQDLPDNRAADRIAFLRGDQTKEGKTVQSFRLRTTVLGDIANSNPLYVARPSAGYYSNDYYNFSSKYALRMPMLYVGANDGMLHGFAADSGEEMFAFVPTAVIPNLAKLTYQGYSHQYFVDGSPVQADAVLNGNWRSVLVAGLNGGGKEIYALDITDPASIAANGADSLVLWEFTAAQDAGLGYTYGRPAVVKLADGRWAAVFGNGYGSSVGKAFLYVVFLDRPKGSTSWVPGIDYIRIPTDDSLTNGLSEITPVDETGTGTTTLVYAGDLNGNLWKFDLSSTKSEEWKVAGNAPLFTTPRTNGAVTQPITSAPDVIRSNNSGFIVDFGTGLYLQQIDPGSRVVQSLYGIFDATTLKPGQTYTVPFNALQQQSILAEVAAGAGTARVTSSNPVDFNMKRGWYMNLVSPQEGQQGERVVFNPTIYGARIAITTLVPSALPCENGGSGWFMELDARTGSALTSPAMDIDGDGAISSSDLVQVDVTSKATVASGLKTSGIPSGFTRLVGAGTTNQILTGGVPTSAITESSTNVTGRLSWREILH